MSPIPRRRRFLVGTGQTGLAAIGRVEDEDRLWRGMKDRYAFIVPRRGWAEYVYRGGIYQQGPGRLALKQPGEMYRDLRRDHARSYDVVLLAPDQVERAAQAAGSRPVVFDRPELDAADPRAQALLALHARLTAPAGDLLAEETAVAEAATALVHLGATEIAPTRERAAVRRARLYLLDRLEEPIRLDDVADHARLDKFHLIRAFRDEVGVPPYEFLTHARIHRARQLLRGGLSAAGVAAALGYYDQSQLHRHFVRLVGLTPGQFARDQARPGPAAAAGPLCFGASASAVLGYGPGATCVGEACWVMM